MSTRKIPRNPERIKAAILADIPAAFVGIASQKQSILAGPIYKGDHRPEPKDCVQCSRKGLRMQMVVRGEEECSHLECPHMRRVTADIRSKS